MKPFWVTFYSYKGGVGRSLALANAAALLAARSRNVLMIDFDLEAPGLDSFKELGVKPGHPGVVEYAHEFQTSGVAPEIDSFVQECKLATPVRGKVWLMPSGQKDTVYNCKRVGLNWEGLYDRNLGELFIENWKAAIFRKYRPDYVFVDSRTGLTDVGGVCTLHLPDLVVLLFGLNDQNLHGTAAVLNTIRKGSSEKPPLVIPVATPVPNLPRTEAGLFKNRMDEAETLLGLKIENTISYNPQAALAEKLFTLEGQDAFVSDEDKPALNRTAFEYIQLLSEIQKRDQNGLDSLLKKAGQACEADDLEMAEKIKKVLLDDYDNRADALYCVGQIERTFNSREQAVQYWKRAFDIDPSQSEAFKALLTFYKQKKDVESILKLHETRIEQAKKDSKQPSDDLYRAQAEEFMSIGQFDAAAKSYERFAQNLPESGFPRLVALFNLHESRRRATGHLDSEGWKDVVVEFEKQSLENHRLDTQANSYQAAHIAYACTGDIPKAKEMLIKAEQCANLAGKVDKFFCVKSYIYRSVEEFLQDNKEMAIALNANELWDGMKLPSNIQP